MSLENLALLIKLHIFVYLKSYTSLYFNLDLEKGVFLGGVFAKIWKKIFVIKNRNVTIKINRTHDSLSDSWFVLVVWV